MSGHHSVEEPSCQIQSVRDSAYQHLEQKKEDGFDNLPVITSECNYEGTRRSEESCYEDEMKNLVD